MASEEKQDLLSRMLASGAIKATTLAESVYFNEKDCVQTSIPIINVALTGALDGGLTSGLTVIAGPSKHFKSNLGLVLLKAYMVRYPDAVCLFYDSEFGITKGYADARSIDPNRVIHIPIIHIEQLKFDLAKRLEGVKRGDHVFILIDSVGNLASKKEVEDAIEEKSAVDMTRAKALKSLFRIVTPHFTIKNIPCVTINHVYDEQNGTPYKKKIVSGGTGIYLSADTIWIVGREQEKEKDEIVGWNFKLNIEKSRYVKEKSQLTFTVTYDKGISKWSGLLDLAVESGHVVKEKKGNSLVYSLKGEEKAYRAKDTDNKQFWMPVLLDKSFRDYVSDEYKIVMTENPEEDYELIYT